MNIADAISGDLEAEIEDRIRGSEGELSAADVLKELISDCDIVGTRASDFRSELRSVGISLGVWVPYTKSQLDQVYVTRGRKYCFKRNHLFYCFESWDRVDALTDMDSIRKAITGGAA